MAFIQLLVSSTLFGKYIDISNIVIALYFIQPWSKLLRKVLLTWSIFLYHSLKMHGFKVKLLMGTVVHPPRAGRGSLLFTACTGRKVHTSLELHFILKWPWKGHFSVPSSCWPSLGSVSPSLWIALIGQSACASWSDPETLWQHPGWGTLV
jgi:hypothetical protein